MKFKRVNYLMEDCPRKSQVEVEISPIYGASSEKKKKKEEDLLLSNPLFLVI